MLERVRPFSGGLPWMFALYNTYNVGERCLEMEDAGGVQHVADVVQQAMTLWDYKPELFWWYDWNHLNVVRTFSCRWPQRYLDRRLRTESKHALVRTRDFIASESDLYPHISPIPSHSICPIGPIVVSLSS